MLDFPSFDFERERERKKLVLVRSCSGSSKEWLDGACVRSVGYAVLVAVTASPK
jgi:hypothetical protein